MWWVPALSAWQKTHASRTPVQSVQGGVFSHCLEEASKIAFHQGMPLKLHVEHTWGFLFCFVSLKNRNHFYNKDFMLPSLKHTQFSCREKYKNLECENMSYSSSNEALRYYFTLHQSWYLHTVVVVSDTKTNQTAGSYYILLLFSLFLPHPTTLISTEAWPKTFCAKTYSDWHINPLQTPP